MNQRNRLPDDFGDPNMPTDESLAEQVHTEQLLSSVLSAPPIDPDFAKSLEDTLAAEFGFASGRQAVNGHASAGLDKLRPSIERNGILFDRETQIATDSAPALKSKAEAEASPAHSHSSLVLRKPVLLAIAATLLLAVGLWGVRPNYSWAAVIEAMNSQPWVQATATRNGTVRFTRWLATRQGIDASQTEGGVVLLVGGAEAEKFSFNNGDTQVTRERDVEGSPRDWRQALPRLLAAPYGRLSTASVVDESWRRVRDDQGKQRIELTVTLLIDGEQATWVLLLDPETHLPVSASPVSATAVEPAEAAEALQFSYPEQGPTTITALGVPEEMAVVTLSREGAREFDLSLEQSTAAAGPGIAEPSTPPTIEPSQPPVIEPPLGEPLAAAELTGRIDQLLQEHWQSVGLTPTKPSSDAEFLRRAYLDLTGRIPTVGEARIFFEDERGDRREQLVDQLLASRDHATHFAAVWRRNLIPPSVDLTPYGGPEQLDQWLADRFQENLAYDDLAADLLLAEGRISESGPLLFYAALKLNPEEIAAQTSRVFLGMQLECAQCHDHPFDDRLAQEDFWGFAALFAQISRPRGQMEVTSSVLRVHDNRRGEVMLPDTDEVVAPRLPLSELAVRDSADAPPRRQQFVDWLIEPHNERFAQATVNRVWAHLFGRGLVDPIDDIREENPAVVPEVLELLALDFSRSDFDFRRLLRQLVLTDAYQLSSEAESDDPSASLAFARMNLKSFTAEQLYDCIAVSTRHAAFAGRPAGDGALVRVGNTNRDQFIELFQAPGSSPVDYHAGIPQALTMMHGGLVHSATDLGSSGLLKSLSAPFFSDDQRIETLFLATLSRLPTPEEAEQMGQHLAGATGESDRQQRLGDILWALLNTAEFTLNH
ncbi:MAG: DUF1549 domain-containing protein [Planctomycetota bacterium]